MSLGGVNIADTFSFVESIAARVGVAFNIFDALSLTDSASIGPIVLPTSVSDNLPLADTVSLFMRLGGIQISDSFSLADVMSGKIDIQADIVDTIDINELISGAMILPGVSVADTLAIAELLNLDVVEQFGDIDISDSFSFLDRINVAIAVQTAEQKIFIGIHDGNAYLKLGGVVTEI
jgi:hypothetical protein